MNFIWIELLLASRSSNYPGEIGEISSILTDSWMSASHVIRSDDVTYLSTVEGTDEKDRDLLIVAQIVQILVCKFQLLNYTDLNIIISVKKNYEKYDVSS